jgi:hypothetical protein
MRLFVLVILLSVAMLMVAAEFHFAQAHDWFPRECCGNGDCYAIDPSELAFEPAGVRVLATGEVFPYQSRQVRETPAEAQGPYFRCSAGGDRAKHTFCVFLAAGGA